MFAIHNFKQTTMLISALNLEKFELKEGDEYLSVLERVFNFRHTNERIKYVRKYIKEQNDSPRNTKNKRKFTFKYDFQKRVIIFTCTVKHQNN